MAIEQHASRFSGVSVNLGREKEKGRKGEPGIHSPVLAANLAWSLKQAPAADYAVSTESGGSPETRYETAFSLGMNMDRGGAYTSS